VLINTKMILGPGKDPVGDCVTHSLQIIATVRLL